MANPLNISQFGITVGPEESAAVRGYDVIINVNDAMPRNLDPYPARLFWIPINEIAPWGYTPFFATKRLLDFYFQKKCNILVHCAAGAHRSPLMVYGWFRSKGYTEQQADNFLRGGCTQMWNRDVETGIIPANLMDMYAVMAGRSTFSLMGVLQEMARRNHLPADSTMSLLRSH